MTSDLGVFLPGGKTGVLLLHDIGGAAAELRAQANAFARAGFTVSCPQLVGIGEAAGSTDRGSAGKLVSEAEQALARLKARCENVVVIGMSYGAMLGLEIARHNAGAVQAVVLLEPRAWLPTLPFAMPWLFSGKLRQTWIAKALDLAGIGHVADAARLPAASLIGAGGSASKPTAAVLRHVAALLDSVHAALPLVKQPVLLVHRPSTARTGRDGSFLLQRRLGGRVESVMADEPGPPGQQSDRAADGLVERCIRFISAVVDEIETRRDNERRRQQVAAGRNHAA